MSHPSARQSLWGATQSKQGPQVEDRRHWPPRPTGPRRQWEGLRMQTAPDSASSESKYPPAPTQSTGSPAPPGEWTPKNTTAHASGLARNSTSSREPVAMRAARYPRSPSSRAQTPVWRYSLSPACATSSFLALPRSSARPATRRIAPSTQEFVQPPAPATPANAASPTNTPARRLAPGPPPKSLRESPPCSRSIWRSPGPNLLLESAASAARPNLAQPEGPAAPPGLVTTMCPRTNL